jgi:hypothetical protein
MYRCGLCAVAVSPKTPALRQVTKTREVVFQPRPGVNRVIDERGKVRWVDDPGGIGTQIVSELLACKVCAKLQA